MIYVTTDRADKAIEPISKTIELGEVSGQLYGMLGFAYMGQENYIAAESAFRNALLMEPKEKNWKLNLFPVHDAAGALQRIQCASSHLDQ
jgi:uncharacterized protein HemY